jgi:hypothetical protein
VSQWASAGSFLSCSFTAAFICSFTGVENFLYLLCALWKLRETWVGWQEAVSGPVPVGTFCLCCLVVLTPDAQGTPGKCRFSHRLWLPGCAWHSLRFEISWYTMRSF